MAKKAKNIEEDKKKEPKKYYQVHIARDMVVFENLESLDEVKDKLLETKLDLSHYTISVISSEEKMTHVDTSVVERTIDISEEVRKISIPANQS